MESCGYINIDRFVLLPAEVCGLRMRSSMKVALAEAEVFVIAGGHPDIRT